jgi:hypothetical protein
LFPKERHRPALEGEDEEEVYAIHFNGDEGHPKDYPMCGLDGNPE